MMMVLHEHMVKSGPSAIASDAAALLRARLSVLRRSARLESAQQVPSRLASMHLLPAATPQHAVQTQMSARKLTAQQLLFHDAKPTRCASQGLSTCVAKSSIASATRADASSSLIVIAQKAISFRTPSRELAAQHQSASGSNALPPHLLTLHQLRQLKSLHQLIPPPQLSPALQVLQPVHHVQSSVSIMRAVNDITAKAGAQMTSHARSTHATLLTTSE